MPTSCLNYPFDAPTILKKKKSLKHELSKHSALVQKRIAILGGSTTSEIKDVLELFLLKKGIQPLFYESEYSRYYEDLMFENAALTEFKPDLIWIHTTVVNIWNFPQLGEDRSIVAKKFDQGIGKFKSIWHRARERFRCPIIQNNFDLPPYRALGNLDSSRSSGRVNFVQRLNLEFADYAESNEGFYINDIHYVSSQIGLKKWRDPRFWYSYKYAVSYEAIPSFAHNLANIIGAIYGRSKKCIVLDLDNTLWGDVIGDDGLANLQIGSETPEAQAFIQTINFRSMRPC